MRGAHTVTRAQSFVPSPLIHPRKALTPQIEIYALENSEVGGPQKVTFLCITVAVGLLCKQGTLHITVVIGAL